MSKSTTWKGLSHWAHSIFKETLILAYSKWFSCSIIIILTISPTGCNGFLDDIRAFRTYKMSSQSMMPTLIRGDCIIVDHKYYRDRLPKRGDIIVFEYPKDSSKDMMKRVIAVEGDMIRGQNKNIDLNDRLIEEPYVQHTANEIIEKLDNFGPITVPADTLFVMGDNRDQSIDSRMFGVVRLEKVKGKALYIYWSRQLSRIGIRLQ